jgi:hypothetical protein
MRPSSVLLLLGCSACSSLEGKQQVAQECHKYQMPIAVGGTQAQAEFLACRQADNSWRITQTTPGLPTQVYTVPPYAADPRIPQ